MSKVHIIAKHVDVKHLPDILLLFIWCEALLNRQKTWDQKSALQQKNKGNPKPTSFRPPVAISVPQFLSYLPLFNPNFLHETTS
jgi:hypothetical protein